MMDTFLGVGDAANPARKGVSPVRKVLGMVVLAVALLMPVQGLMAGEKEMKKEEVDLKSQEAMEMMKEKKMKTTPEQEKKMMTVFEEFEKYLDSLYRGG